MDELVLEALDKLPREMVDSIVNMVKHMKSQIDKKQTIGEAGAGIVKVTVNSKNRIKEVKIDCELKKENKLLIETLIPVAHSEACEKMTTICQEISTEMMHKTRKIADDFNNKHKVDETDEFDPDLD